MPFPNVTSAPTEDAYTHAFDEKLRDAMEKQIATLSAAHGLAGVKTATRHAAVVYLGLLYLRGLEADQQDGEAQCANLCLDALKRTAVKSEGRTINAAQFCGHGKSKGNSFRNHEPALNIARASYLGARLKAKNKRNLIFLLIGCEHGQTVKPPDDDSWVDG